MSQLSIGHSFSQSKQSRNAAVIYSSETPESKGSSFRGFTLPKISFELSAVEQRGKDRKRGSQLITLNHLDSDKDEQELKSDSNHSENAKDKFQNFEYLCNPAADHLIPKENLSVVEEECLTSK